MSVVEIVKELIKFETVTPKEEGVYSYIRSFLKDFTVLELNKNQVKNLFLYKKFGEGVHLSFAGHVDVVPAGDGWSFEPFNPKELDGYIYGRGTQDMKGGVGAFVSAVSKVKDFNGTLSLLLTSDEEGDALYGTQYVLEELKTRNLLPDVCIVAEPTCEEKFGDAIKVGRRGSINGYLEIQGKSGHAAYPEKADNPLSSNFGSFLSQISEVSLDNGDEFFAPSVLIVTDMRSGYEVTNLTPGKLNLMFNVRNSTETNKEDVENFVKKKLEECSIENFHLRLTQGSFPFITKEGKYSKILINNVRKAVKEITGIEAKKSTAGGTSDARYIAAAGIDVVELGVVNDRIHGPDERVPVKELEDLEKVFKRVIELF